METTIEITQDTKWTPSNLGPRMAKMFNQALSAFSWEAKTKTEITDFGSHSFAEMIGGSWQPAAAPALLAIKIKYNATVTGDNYKAIIADLEAATANLKATRPVIDRRTSPEERAERERIAAENKAAADAKAAHLATLKTHAYSLSETARAIKTVLSTLFPNTVFSVRSDSYSMGCSIDATWTDGPTQTQVNDIMGIFSRAGFDGMQDLKTYNAAPEWNGHRFDFHGDYCKGDRKVSAEFLYDCAERFILETGVEVQINTDDPKYPYIERSNAACGWSFYTHGNEYPNGVLTRDECSNFTASDIIYQIHHHTSREAAAIEYVNDWPEGESEPANSLRAVVFGIILGEIGKPAEDQPSTAATTNAGITVRENKAKGGVEIVFDSKPSAATLDALKARKWRWSGRNKCWYTRYSREALEFAHKIAGTQAPESSPAAGVEDYPCSDAGYEDQCAAQCGEGL